MSIVIAETKSEPKPKTWDWKRWPRNGGVRQRVDRRGTEGNEFAANLAQRMKK